MKIPIASRWNVTPSEAMQIQRELAARVSEQDALRDVRLIAGVDVGFEGAQNQIARAAVVVFQLPELDPVDYAIARLPVSFPYVPGLLAFREIPVVLDALKNLTTDPDVLIVDGQGRAHPRRLGIASHLGVLLDCVTIGCAKSILCGRAKEPPNRVGAWTPLLERGEQIGAAVRTRAGVTPVYVSVGHRISLARAVDLILRCCKGYRLPETTRYAHRVAGGEQLNLDSVQASLL
ncbi:MAG: deoxyribonuclease V [Anaerolineales bacterium]|nr:deoxyribonuclease V [Anaerolineales bacterium]